MLMDNEQLSDSGALREDGEWPAFIDDFKKAYGEEFSTAIDINTWRIGENLAELYPSIEKELIEARQDEKKTHQTFRDVVFPKIKELASVPHAGLHDEVKSEEIIEKIHKGFLFNGSVTACGSVSSVYNSVPISITQIGICLVNYQGQHGSYSHRLFRRDLRYKGDDPVKEAIDLIERRRSDDETNNSRARLSEIAVRGIKTFAERSILLEKSDSRWLLGAGTPVPNELMRGFWSSRKEMKEKSIALIRKMILDHSHFVYVQDCSRNPQLWTFGNALNPFEYLIIDTIKDGLEKRLASGGMRGEFLADYKKMVADVGDKVAIGVYRVSKRSAPQIFYCHTDHIQIAALIAMADSVLQMHLGSPMLLDLAGNICKTAFGQGDFIASIEQAYAKAETLVNLTL
jgi:hypothetical protein